MIRLTGALLLLVSFSLVSYAQPQQKRTFASLVENARKVDGFLPLYVNSEEGKIFLEVSSFNKEFLYLVSLPTGVGSNPIGLDRGQPGSTKLVFFERAGNKILLVQPNYRFRASSGDSEQKRSVEESFARSVIWGFKIEASDGGRFLVDATSFIIRDAHEVSDRLNRARQGSYSFDESRSALYLPNIKGFPKNTEIETTITLTTNSGAGGLVNQVAPTGKHITVRQRHSFVKLPDDNYRPRKYDPRVGVFSLNFYDYGTDINQDLEKRWIRRFRLEKKDPSAEMSQPIEPIIFYVDNGAPKAIQDALLEGAAWWDQAFEAAGFKGAFQVKVLPADADPMDIRFNVINWVHRSTRGWSIGNSIVDPRTGEVLRGIVTLDSQRARQDFLIGTGLLPQYASGEEFCAFAASPDLEHFSSELSAEEITAMSYARIRQLSAHEVGHTLGLAHNFAGSTYGDASVMDYPAPNIAIKNGRLDFTNAYDKNIGEFDKFSVTYAYKQFGTDKDEDRELENIVARGIADGMLYLTDQDARPLGGAHPLANLWDNGSDPVARLRHEMDVRRLGIEGFGLKNIPVGTPLSELENKFVPLFLHHRYQVAAAAKSLGGVYYTFSVRSANGPAPAQVSDPVPGEKQREALSVLISTLAPEQLAVPERILKLIPPTAIGYRSERSELFPKRTAPVFDPLGVAEISAGMVISNLLEPSRAARMISLNMRDKNLPHFREATDALVSRASETTSGMSSYHENIQLTVRNVIAQQMMDLAANTDAQQQVRVTAMSALRSLQTALSQSKEPGESTSFNNALIADIEKFFDRPADQRKLSDPLAIPPGDPIGNR